MASYRFGTGADAQMIATWATTPVGTPPRTPIQLVAQAGYAVETPTLAQLTQYLNAPDQRWGLAFDNGGNLRAAIVGYVINRTAENSVWIAMYMTDPSLTLAHTRTHRDEIMRIIRNQIPDGWMLRCHHVPAGAVRAHEWLAANWTLTETYPATGPAVHKSYESTIEAWRLKP